MTTGIYGIFYKKTNECLYIGQSKDIEERWNDHIKRLKAGNHRRKEFVEWFKSIGKNVELLDFRVLEECENERFLKNKIEEKWFNKLKPKFYGKIATEFGIYEHTETARQNISKALKEYYKNNKHHSKNSRKKRQQKKCLNKECLNLFNDVNNKKYCSVLCYNKIRTEKITKTCLNPNCLQLFKISNTKKELKRKYCCPNCSFEHTKQLNAENNKIRDKKIIELYIKENLSQSEIGKIMNISQPGILGILKKHNIEMKSHGFQSQTEILVREKMKRPFRKCPICGKDFRTRSKSCSRECGYKLANITLTKRKNNYKKDRYLNW